MRLLAASTLLLALAGSLTAAKPPLSGQSLHWTPTTEISELKLGSLDLTGLEGQSIEVLPFVDSRTNPTLVGENREDADEGKVLPVTTKDRVADFVALQTRTFLKNLGLPIVESGAKVQISGELISYFVTETGTYKGDVRIKVQVKVDGQIRWSGLALGSAKRFGRSYRMDNYNEVLCDSLLDAWAGLVRNPEFMKALGAGK